jgi:hypothetical protein
MLIEDREIYIVDPSKNETVSSTLYTELHKVVAGKLTANAFAMFVDDTDWSTLEDLCSRVLAEEWPDANKIDCSEFEGSDEDLLEAYERVSDSISLSYGARVRNAHHAWFWVDRSESMRELMTKCVLMLREVENNPLLQLIYKNSSELASSIKNKVHLRINKTKKKK